MPAPSEAPLSSIVRRIDSEPSGSAHSYLVGGALTVLLIVVGFGGWAATTLLSSAVIAQGTVMVESSVKKVQHPNGGIVSEIRVKDGDAVKAGDLLLRLDETQTRANLQIITKQLDQLAVRRVRLEAERDGQRTLVLPDDLEGRRDEDEIKKSALAEGKLLETRLQGREGQKAQLLERITQLKQEIGGLTSQQEAKTQEIAFVKTELGGLEQLWEQKLTTLTKITEMRRESTRLDGERGQLVASAAQAQGKIAETELQILQVDQDLRTEVSKELREIETKEAELAERRVAAEDQLNRIDIRSPQTGIVHQLSVHTVGGVVEAGEQIMLIVPEGDKLIIEIHIAPRDIDQVHTNEAANIRFPAFNMRTTPEFKGMVSRIAADLTHEQQTGISYYVARVILSEEAEAARRALGLSLVPGMPAEVQIQTSQRTALSYLLKPVEDGMAQAFKER